ncbi:MAG: hypothetical protein GF400_05370 [Candidatus Eisenbacteria bacterium]|nr:hypothetical protein [Candidatus Eisenbacteria bacterium]
MKARLSTLFGVLVLLSTAAGAATIRVDLNGQGDYTAIQEGIDAASAGDTVLVAAGTYTGPQNRDIDFGGRDLTLLAESGRDVTIIDCESADRAFVFDTGESRYAVVQGFTIRNGTGQNGGAVWMRGASPQFLECSFENNSAGFGGAFYIGLESAPFIEFCTFTGNYAVDYGGAIYTYSSQPGIYYCEFLSNTAGISGGAISCKTWTIARILYNYFTGNYAHDGGCIYVGTLFADFEEAEQTQILFNEFVENSAVRGGALFLQSFSWVGCSWSTFLRNSATQGGAVFCRTDAEGDFTLQNCTIVYNSAETGGGICSSGSSSSSEFLITQCVIAYSTTGSSLQRIDYSPVTADLSLAYGNQGGDMMFGTDRLLYEDPMFCDVASDDYNLCEESPCRSVNNEWGFLMGSFRQTCECDTPVEETSWGSIKAMFR